MTFPSLLILAACSLNGALTYAAVDCKSLEKKYNYNKAACVNDLSARATDCLSCFQEVERLRPPESLAQSPRKITTADPVNTPAAPVPTITQNCIHKNEIEISAAGLAIPFFQPISSSTAFQKQQITPPPIRAYGYGVEFFHQNKLLSVTCSKWDHEQAEKKHGAVSSCTEWCIIPVTEDKDMYPKTLLEQTNACETCGKKNSASDACKNIRVLRKSNHLEINSPQSGKMELSVSLEGNLLMIPVASKDGHKKTFYKISRQSLSMEKAEFLKQNPNADRLKIRGEPEMPSHWNLASTKIDIINEDGKILNTINRTERSYRIANGFRHFGIRTCDVVPLNPGVCSRSDYEFQSAEALKPPYLKPNCLGMQEKEQYGQEQLPDEKLPDEKLRDKPLPAIQPAR